MTWLNAGAFVGLFAIAAPILVHLLARRRARAQVFPSLRFIGTARVVAPNRARLTDAALLAVRIAIVGAAVAALAQPLWLSESRRDLLGRSVARVVVVDTSASMRRASAAGENGLTVARRESARLAAEAATALVVESARPASELEGAAAWLAQAGAARTELVVVSDFQSGAIERVDLARVYAEPGVRLLRVAVDTTQLALDAALTEATGSTIPRLGVLASDSDSVVARVTLEVATRGMTASVDERRVTIVFPGYAERERLFSGANPPDSRWMGDIAWTTRDHAASVAVDSGGGLLVFTDEPAGSLNAARLIRDVSLATSHSADAAEWEPGVVSDSALRSWEREPAPASAARAGALAGSSDARWLWFAVLVLLVAEHAMRRRASAQREGTGNAS